jgi:subtilase family serine protease
VIAVGGTSLKRSTSARGWSEAAWNGAGSGCSTLYAKPGWQVDSGCARRTVADVSAVADPNTGVAVYGPTSSTQSAWLVFGGTSVAAPLIGGIYGVNGGSVNYGGDPYSHVSALFDVISGSNGSCGGSYLCTAKTGYDGPTGLGTPNGAGGF